MPKKRQKLDFDPNFTFTPRAWQAEALKRAWKTNGIFLEAASGRGKTLCALEICKQFGVKSIMIVNKKLSILNGWLDEIDQHYPFSKTIVITDKTLANRLNKGEKFDVDILIIDEWQDMCSDSNLKNYQKIKRKYTIGLSATPIRRKGTNFFGLEQTIWGYANPSNKRQWQSYWGLMAPDPWTAFGLKWTDFRDYQAYIKQLPCFMDFDEIEAMEQAERNNGHDLRYVRYRLPVANPEKIKDFYNYNLVRVGNQSVMAKQSFGRNIFLRYLRQAAVNIDFPKLIPVNSDASPTLQKIDELIRQTPYGLLIVTKSTHMAEIIKHRNPHIAIWTGQHHEDNGEQIMVATQQVMGVGVDGLQSRFAALLILDPVLPSSGEYNDYRQLLWRITGPRQQHDVVVIEFYYEDQMIDTAEFANTQN